MLVIVTFSQLSLVYGITSDNAANKSPQRANTLIPFGIWWSFRNGIVDYDFYLNANGGITIASVIPCFSTKNIGNNVLSFKGRWLVMDHLIDFYKQAPHSGR